MFNILLQVLDNGRLTDNKGRTVNFKNTIIIMTSNLGSQMINDEIRRKTETLGNTLDEGFIITLKNKILDMLKQTIRPEFLNRIDETIMFLPLRKDEIANVVRLQMNAVKRMLEPQGFELNITDAAVDILEQEGFDPEFGARLVLLFI